MESNEYPNLSAVLQEYGQEFRNLYQDKLVLADKIATGDLLNSVEFRLRVADKNYQVVINLADYWKYVEEGIAPAGKYGNPGWKALPHIRDWIVAKPLLPQPKNLSELNSRAYLITRKIVNEGIEPTPLMAETSATLNMKYRSRIIEAFRKDMYMTLRDSAFSNPLR